MAEVIRMPRMSDTMEEGNIVGWLKKVGDAVEPGDVLAEVETDKATMELENYHEGVLLYIGVKEGSVPVNAVLAVIGAEGEDFEAALAAENGGAPASPKSASEEPAPGSSAPSGTTAPATVPTTSENSKSETGQASPQIQAGHSGEETGRTKASPLARSIASQAGIDLKAVQGSGDGGRIVKRDVESVMQQSGTSATSGSPTSSPTPPPAPSNREAPATKVTPPSAAPASEGSYDVPTSQMRKVIARRLAESKFSAPHFYLGIEVDMTNAISYRKQLNTLSDTKVSFNDLIVKSCAHALRKHPAINSSWLGDAIRYNADINIGVAVAVEDGLLVPVVRHADRKGFAEINAEVKQMAGLAKERKLQPQQMQGNTFTISNLGMFDITEFTAIINPPDACILAVGSIQEKPVVRAGEIVVGNVMKLTLSCDHRVVDGATGAMFLATLKGMLEQPLTILL